MKRLKIMVLGILIILWGGFILYNSSQGYEASNNRSNHIVDKIKEEAPKNESINQDANTNNKVNNNRLNLIVRKSAHFMQYFVFAILIILMLDILNIKSREKVIYTLFAILLFATCDEFYQGFVDGRTSSVRDVLIDFLGGFTGVLVLRVIVAIKVKFKDIINLSIN